MPKLPNPKNCANHDVKLILESVEQNSKPTSYDLVKMNKGLQSAKQATMKNKSGIILDLASDLINPALYLDFSTQEKLVQDQEQQNLLTDPLFEKILGYSYKYKSLTMTLADADGGIQTIVVRHATDKDGNKVKWKTYGSKKYTPYKICNGEDFVFLYSGMAELLLVKSLDFSYIGLQSDSMVKHLPQELKQLTKNKVLVILQDNDDSFKKIVPVIKEFFSSSLGVVTIDFEKLLGTKLAKGYDFRDFCNQIANAEEIKNKLIEEIKNEFRS